MSQQITDPQSRPQESREVQLFVKAVNIEGQLKRALQRQDDYRLLLIEAQPYVPVGLQDRIREALAMEVQS